MINNNIKLNDIINNKEIYGNNNIYIDGLSLCNRESDNQSILTYISDERYIKYLKNSPKIKAVYITKKFFEMLDSSLKYHKTYIIADNPEIEFYKLHEYLLNNTSFYKMKDFKSIIGNNVIINKGVFIDEGVIIGDNVTINNNTVIKRGTVISNNVQIGCNCTIGTDGFHVIYNGKEPFLVKHIGGVKIGKNVIIKDNTTISKSLFEGYTIVEDNCMIDSQVHIGHNSIIMKNSVLTANVTLLGSVIIKNNVWISPSSTIMNRVVIGENCFVGIGSVVLNNVPDNVKVLGVPARKTQF